MELISDVSNVIHMNYTGSKGVNYNRDNFFVFPFSIK